VYANADAIMRPSNSKGDLRGRGTVQSGSEPAINLILGSLNQFPIIDLFTLKIGSNVGHTNHQIGASKPIKCCNNCFGRCRIGFKALFTGVVGDQVNRRHVNSFEELKIMANYTEWF
jgi:hypothetical protein